MSKEDFLGLNFNEGTRIYLVSKSKPIFYQIDSETNEPNKKIRFRPDGTIDEWKGITEKGYSHDVYSDKSHYVNEDSGDVFTRAIGDDTNKTWSDRDGVLKQSSTIEESNELTIENEKDADKVEESELTDDNGDDFEKTDDENNEKMNESDLSDDISGYSDFDSSEKSDCVD